MTRNLSIQPTRSVKSGRWPLLWLVGVAACLGISAGVAYSQVGGGYDLSWATADGGGGTFSTGGSFSLGGTAGQPDAGTSAGGAFTLNSGFWGRSVVVATISPTSTPTRTPTQVALLVGHVTWQGRPAQPNALQQVVITLTLKSSATEVNYPSEITDSSGFFTVSVGALPTGAYNWRVKDPKYLANSGAVALSGAPQTNAEMGLMRAGDANNDNVVSVVDFNILKGTFGKAAGQSGYDDRADFDGNYIVNVQDFNVQKQNFGTGGAPPINPLR